MVKMAIKKKCKDPPRSSPQCSVNWIFLQSCDWSRHPPGPVWMPCTILSNPFRWLFPWTRVASSQACSDQYACGWETQKCRRCPEPSLCGPLLSDTLSYEYLLPSSPWTSSFMSATQGVLWTLPQWSGLQPRSGIQTEAVTELSWFVSHLSGFLSFITWYLLYQKTIVSYTVIFFFFLLVSWRKVRDFPGDPVVKNLPRNARDSDLIPGQGTKIPHAMELLNPRATTTEPTHHH